METPEFFVSDERTRPALKWAGGKSGPLEQLIARFPSSIKTYLEPFLGGGAVFFSLREGLPAIVGDSNRELFELYEAIRDTPNELMKHLDEMTTRYSESYYYELRGTLPTEKIQRAGRTLFLNKTGFNGLFRLNSKGLFNVPFGKRVKCPALYKRENFERISRHLARATLLNTDFERIIDQAGPGDFVYCDPPYHPLSPTSVFTSYTAAGFTRQDQVRLEKACSAAVDRGARVAVSNSSTRFTRSLYSNWTVHEILARRAINSKATLRGEITEVLAVRGY